MARKLVLVADAEYLVRWSLAEQLKEAGFRCTSAETGAEAVEKFRAEAPDLVFLDVNLANPDGPPVLERMKALASEVPVIMLATASHIDKAVKALRSGAYDYVRKPFEPTEVNAKANHAVENRLLKREAEAIRRRRGECIGFGDIIGRSPPMQELVELAHRVADSTDSTVLLLGESGTGKDLLAQAIHCESTRRDRPFIPINCTALPEELLESELMGHERGAFTDAKTTKKGLFELADGGTLFLDEIGDMKPRLQSKLLRFLENRTFKRIGGQQDISVDVRVIAATHRDLESAIETREFRQDLYYRINVVPIILPPLRERTDDILALARHFLRGFNREVSSINDSAQALLLGHDWPGNVRELRNVMERAVILSTGPEVTEDSLPLLKKREQPAHPARAAQQWVVALPEDGIPLEVVERELIVQAMDRTGQNQTRAARLLGLTRDALRYRMKKHALL